MEAEVATVVQGAPQRTEDDILAFFSSWGKVYMFLDLLNQVYETPKPCGPTDWERSEEWRGIGFDEWE